MEHLEIINSGNDNSCFDILAPNEMDSIMGGDVDCKRKYIEGNIECHKRYTQVGSTILCKKKYSNRNV